MILTLIYFGFNFFAKLLNKAEQSCNDEATIKEDRHENLILKQEQDEKFSFEENPTLDSCSINGTKRNSKKIGCLNNKSYSHYHNRKENIVNWRDQCRVFCTFELLYKNFDNFDCKNISINDSKTNFKVDFEIYYIKFEEVTKRNLKNNYKYMDNSNNFFIEDKWHKVCITIAANQFLEQNEFDILYNEGYSQIICGKLKYTKNKKLLEFVRYGSNDNNTVYGYYIRHKSDSSCLIPVFELKRNNLKKSTLDKPTFDNTEPLKHDLLQGTSKIANENTKNPDLDDVTNFLEIETDEDKDYFKEILKLHKGDLKKASNVYYFIKCLKKHTDTSIGSIKTEKQSQFSSGINNNLLFEENEKQLENSYKKGWFDSCVINEIDCYETSALNNLFEDNTTYEEFSSTREGENLFNLQICFDRSLVSDSTSFSDLHIGQNN